ncbi:MAG: hypothetical protein L3J59_09070 [Methylococcaceae bacterium]|nr:hypothetical protein [Methylococcaceae bacterium]
MCFTRATYITEEPDAVVPQVRICMGAVQVTGRSTMTLKREVVMNEIHSISRIYPINMPNKFFRGRKKQPEKNHSELKKNLKEHHGENESTAQHIDEIV